MNNDESRSDSSQPNRSADHHPDSQKDWTEDPQGKTTQHIDAVFAEGAAVLSALAAAGKLGYNVYQGSGAGSGAGPDPAKPLLVSVLATRTTENSHDIVVLIKNFGIHGVYLDGLSVNQPKGISIRAVEQKSIPRDHSMIRHHPWDRYYGRGGFGTPLSADEEKPPEALPAFVSADGEVCLVVQMSQFDEKRIEKKPYGKLELAYVVAGVAESGLSETIEFSVRRLYEDDA